MVRTRDPRQERTQRLLRTLLGSAYPVAGPAGWTPPTDVYETDRYLVVRVEIAGLQADDYRVLLDGRRLRVEGIRRDPAAKLVYQQMEIAYGPFVTEMELPSPVDEKDVEASYEDGFLTIVLAKSAPRKVDISVRG